MRPDHESGYAIAIDDSSQIGEARRTATAIARAAGMTEVEAGKLAIIATEAATNISKHATRGEIILRLSDMKKSFPAEYTSPRNTAASTAKRFDEQGAEHLTMLFYDVADHVDMPTEQEKFA